LTLIDIGIDRVYIKLQIIGSIYSILCIIPLFYKGFSVFLDDFKGFLKHILGCFPYIIRVSLT